MAEELEQTILVATGQGMGMGMGMVTTEAVNSANVALLEFCATPEAWWLSLEVLMHPRYGGVATQFFAAATLQRKMESADWDATLTPVEKQRLIDALWSILRDTARSGNDRDGQQQQQEQQQQRQEEDQREKCVLGDPKLVAQVARLCACGVYRMSDAGNAGIAGMAAGGVEQYVARAVELSGVYGGAVTNSSAGVALSMLTVLPDVLESSTMPGGLREVLHEQLSAVRGTVFEFAESLLSSADSAVSALAVIKAWASGRLSLAALYSDYRGTFDMLLQMLASAQPPATTGAVCACLLEIMGMREYPRSSAHEEAAQTTLQAILCALDGLFAVVSTGDADAALEIVRCISAMAFAEVRLVVSGSLDCRRLAEFVIQCAATPVPKFIAQETLAFFTAVCDVPLMQRHPYFRQEIFMAATNAYLSQCRFPEDFTDSWDNYYGEEDEEAFYAFRGKDPTRGEGAKEFFNSCYLTVRDPLLEHLSTAFVPGVQWQDSEVAMYVVCSIIREMKPVIMAATTSPISAQIANGSAAMTLSGRHGGGGGSSAAGVVDLTGLDDDNEDIAASAAAGVGSPLSPRSGIAPVPPPADGTPTSSTPPAAINLSTEQDFLGNLIVHMFTLAADASSEHVRNSGAQVSDDDPPFSAAELGNVMQLQLLTTFCELLGESSFLLISSTFLDPADRPLVYTAIPFLLNACRAPECGLAAAGAFQKLLRHCPKTLHQDTTMLELLVRWVENGARLVVQPELQKAVFAVTGTITRELATHVQLPVVADLILRLCASSLGAIREVCSDPSTAAQNMVPVVAPHLELIGEVVRFLDFPTTADGMHVAMQLLPELCPLLVDLLSNSTREPDVLEQGLSVMSYSIGAAPDYMFSHLPAVLELCTNLLQEMYLGGSLRCLRRAVETYSTQSEEAFAVILQALAICTNVTGSALTGNPQLPPTAQPDRVDSFFELLHHCLVVCPSLVFQLEQLDGIIDLGLECLDPKMQSSALRSVLHFLSNCLAPHTRMLRDFRDVAQQKLALCGERTMERMFAFLAAGAPSNVYPALSSCMLEICNFCLASQEEAAQQACAQWIHRGIALGYSAYWDADAQNVVAHGVCHRATALPSDFSAMITLLGDLGQGKQTADKVLEEAANAAVP